jgi:hypothetical protein
MKRALLSLCLSGAVVSAPTALDFTPAPNLHDSDAISIVAPRNTISIVAPRNTTSPLQSTETVALQSEQNEVHSVVVDMPQVISLAYASPETWGSLPTSVPQYEEPPATPTLQLAPYEQHPAKPTLQLAMNPQIEDSN